MMEDAIFDMTGFVSSQWKKKKWSDQWNARKEITLVIFSFGAADSVPFSVLWETEAGSFNHWCFYMPTHNTEF